MKKLRYVLYGVFVLILIALISVWYSSRKPIVSGVPSPSQVLVTKLETEHTHTECPNTFMSWNIANFGRRRTDEEIAFMASILAPADIVAIQEVTAGKHFGAQAIGKLADALSRTGSA